MSIGGHWDTGGTPVGYTCPWCGARILPNQPHKCAVGDITYSVTDQTDRLIAAIERLIAAIEKLEKKLR